MLKLSYGKTLKASGYKTKYDVNFTFYKLSFLDRLRVLFGVPIKAAFFKCGEKEDFILAVTKE